MSGGYFGGNYFGAGSGGISPADVAAIWAYTSRTLTQFPSLVTYTGPVNQQGTLIQLTRGAAYKSALGNALVWSFTGQPDLTTATITLKTNGILSDASGAVAQPTGNQSVKVELSVAQTQAAKLSSGEFQLWCTLGSDSFVLVEGTIKVEDNLG